MRKNMISALALSTLALLCLPVGLTATAQAQEPPKDGGSHVVNQYDPKYRPSFVREHNGPEDEYYEDSGLIPDDIYGVELVRLPDARENEVTLRLISPGSVSGCMNMVPPEADIKTLGRTLKVEITDGRLTATKKEGVYSLHECPVQVNSSKVDVTLDRDALIEHKTNKIIFLSRELGPFLNIKLAIDKDKALFTGSIFDLSRMGQPFKNGDNKQIYWFYPKNTVILLNTSLKMTDDNIAKIREFAHERGLIPLTDFQPDFRTTHENRHKLYFVDVDGAYADQLEDPDTIFTLGNAELKELYHGAEGPYEKTVPKPVFVKRPGLYE